MREELINILFLVLFGIALGMASSGWIVTTIAAKAQIAEVKNCSRDLMDQYNLLLAAFRLAQPDSKERAAAGSQAFTDRERERRKRK